jgi:hypothetical protein
VYLPERLDLLMAQLATHLDAFEAQMQTRDNLKKSNSYDYAIEQLVALKPKQEDAAVLVRRAMTLQKGVNRTFVPKIAFTMAPAYRLCRDERGGLLDWFWVLTS